MGVVLLSSHAVSEGWLTAPEGDVPVKCARNSNTLTLDTDRYMVVVGRV